MAGPFNNGLGALLHHLRQPNSLLHQILPEGQFISRLVQPKQLCNSFLIACKGANTNFRTSLFLTNKKELIQHKCSVQKTHRFHLKLMKWDWKCGRLPGMHNRLRQIYFHALRARRQVHSSWESATSRRRGGGEGGRCRLLPRGQRAP